MGQAETPWEWHIEGCSMQSAGRSLRGAGWDSPGFMVIPCPLPSTPGAGRHRCGEAPGPAGGRERAPAAGDESVRGGAAGAAAAAAGTVPGLSPPAGESLVVAVVVAG